MSRNWEGEVWAVGEMPGPELQMLRSEISSYGPIMGWAESGCGWAVGGRGQGAVRWVGYVNVKRVQGFA